MKRNRFYIFPNLSILFVQGIIVLFFSISIVILVNFRPTWFFSFDGISENVEKKVKSVDKQSFSYGEKYPYYLGLPIYEDIDWLTKNMTKEEAQKILSYPNPVVRVTAYRNLLNYNFDKNQTGSYELLCQVLQEYDVLQGSSGSCVGWVAPTGWFFSDMYFYLGEEGGKNKEQIDFLKKMYRLKDSEIKHLVHLQQIAERKIDSIYKALR